jgi:hypothetical protein
VEEAEAKLRDEMLRVARDQDEKHAKGRQSFSNLLECEVRRLKEDVGDFFAKSEARHKEHDEKHTIGRAAHASALEESERKLRDELSVAFGASDAQHREVRAMIPRAVELLEGQFAERLKETNKCFGESLDSHRAATDRLGNTAAKLQQDLGQLTQTLDLKINDQQAKHQAALSEAMSVLREESLRSCRELDAEQRRSTAQLCSEVESLENRVKDEIVRCEREQDSKREAMQSSTLSTMESCLANHDAALREDLNRLALNNDRLHDDNTDRMNTGLEALDRKVVDTANRLSAEAERKRDESRVTTSLHIEDVANKIRSDLSRAVDTIDSKHQEGMETTKDELINIRDVIEKLGAEQDAKHETGRDRTAVALETLERKFADDLAVRSAALDTECEVRSREVADLCAAVKSLQSWVTDVEAVGTQRNEMRNRDFDAVADRHNELKQQHLALRSDLSNFQELVDTWKRYEVNKITDELRSVVSDLSIASNLQADKIQHLETNLDAAREAKAEVHRISSDLAAEATARTTKDAELKSRLDREVTEMSRRVDRLTGASCDLATELRHSEARTSNVLSSPRGSRNGSLLGVDF